MRIPVTTYRLQLNQRFTFGDAAGVVGYLHDLGITDLYASPVSAARAGSIHGYDVVDHERLNPELGGEEAFARLSDALRARQMAVLLDIVPNHMCIASDKNRRWLDVLENGPSSLDARFFDIDWRPPKAELQGRVLLPVLGDQFGRVLETHIQAGYQDGAFFLSYYETRVPMTPRSWLHVLEPALGSQRGRFGDEHPMVLELESIVRAIGHLPSRTESAPAKVRERRHEREIIQRRLASLMAYSAETRGAVEDSLRVINGEKGQPHTFDRLEKVVAEQAYRPSDWRVAAHEINYRRFFDINDLAAIRVEDPVVFAAVHALPLRLAREGIVTGFRIDHVDGLYDPEKYLQDLQHGFRETTGQESCFVVVEKILAPDEKLPPEWPVAGTTGYEFLGLVSSVLVDPSAGPHLRDLAARLGGPDSFADEAYASKKLVLHTAMSAELAVLARRLDRISEQHRYTRDFTLTSLREVLTEVIASFPVYRTYIRPGDTIVGERDRRPIEMAIRLGKRRNPVMNESLFDFVRSVLMLEEPDGLTEAQRAERREFVLRMQQLTGPVMAKGLEDTAFYRYFPLAALNEVGGDPDAFGYPIEEFHRRNAERARTFPHGLSASATHDTKRGEDTRARLIVLSEMPEAWADAVDRWRALNRPHRGDGGGFEAPDGVEELLLYQTLVGACPPGGVGSEPGFPARVREYLHKALLEAKVHTSWVNHNEPYEAAVARFVDAVLDPRRSPDFLDDLQAFVTRVAEPGYWTSLAQVLLKVASPGIPDFYQGTELWDFSLVDPDNRRPVDYETRRRLLAELNVEAERDLPALAARLMAEPRDGRLKLLVTTRALSLRRAHARLFAEGDYQPLTVTGSRAAHVVAFARTHENEAVIAVTGRHFVRLGGRPTGETWADTKLQLPANLAHFRFSEALTARPLNGRIGSPIHALPVAEVLAHLPVAMISARR